MWLGGRSHLYFDWNSFHNCVLSPSYWPFKIYSSIVKWKVCSLIKENSRIRKQVSENETILLLLQVKFASRCAFAIFVAPGIEHAKCFFLFLNLNCSFSFTCNSQMPTFTCFSWVWGLLYMLWNVCVKTPHIKLKGPWPRNMENETVQYCNH